MQRPDRNSLKQYVNHEMRNAVEAELESHRQILELIDKAVECPEYESGLDLNAGIKAFEESVLEQIDALRAVMRVLSGQARQQIANGQQEDAACTCRKMFRICRHFDQVPSLECYLAATKCRLAAVNKANQAMRIGSLPVAVRDDLEAELARHETDEPYQTALITEYAYALQSFREFGSDTSSYNHEPPWMTGDPRRHFGHFDVALSQSGFPYGEACRAMAKYSLQVNPNQGICPVFTPLAPTLYAACELRTQLRALRILNVLHRQPCAAGSTLPQLSDLALPPIAIIDPYNGGPLHLKQRPGGWLIYAVGTNLHDDGGRLPDEMPGSSSVDIGLGPQLVTENGEAIAPNEP